MAYDCTSSIIRAAETTDQLRTMRFSRISFDIKRELMKSNGRCTRNNYEVSRKTCRHPDNKKTTAVAAANLNPSWHTTSNLLSAGNCCFTDCTKSGLGLVNANPKNKPEKLLCTVLLMMVPDSKQRLMSHPYRTRATQLKQLRGMHTKVVVLVLHKEGYMAT